MKALIIVSALLFSTASFAEFEKHEPAKIDFNRMIEDNLGESQKIQQELNRRGFGERPKTADSKVSLNRKKRVTDFLDAELGWGEAPKVVDRRAN